MTVAARDRNAWPIAWTRSLALLSLLWCSSARTEEKIEPIDAEFLEYLAEMEGTEEDWTLFESEEPRKRAPASKPAEPPPKPRASKPVADESSKDQ